MDTASTSRQSSIDVHNNNITMLLDKLKELRMSAENNTNARVYSKVENLLRKEIDKVEMSQYFGLDNDSDKEIEEDMSDTDYHSADEKEVAKSITYNIDQMFEIVKKRVFNKWSMATIHSRYKLVKDGDAGKKQISRMQQYIKRGCVSNRIAYQRLKEEVWNEVYSLLTEGVVLHDRDIQQIAMIKAGEKGLHNFKASDGWTYYFKKQHNLVDRHIDKVGVSVPAEDEEKLKEVVDDFKKNKMPEIIAYPREKIWNADQMGLQLEITQGRTLALRGTKKVIRRVQRINATTHSYTVHIQMNAAGYLCSKLPVVLYEPSGVPKKFKEDVLKFTNLHVYHSKSGLMGSEIAKQWMSEVFLENVEEDCLLIIDAWNGYNQMIQMPEITEKKLKIIKLPEHTTPVLQPADVYFNRPFKDFIRKICGKIRWMHNDFTLALRNNLLTILDMVYYQCKAPRFGEFLKYAWYRAGYYSEHPQEFLTPVQYCLGFKGYMKCENADCTNYCFLLCAYCRRHFCFYDAIEHRD